MKQILVHLFQSRLNTYMGKKINCPGARDKLNFRQDKHIFSLNVRRTSKKLNASIFFLDMNNFFDNRTSKNFDGLARGQMKMFRFFYPCHLVNSFTIVQMVLELMYR